MFFTDFGVVRTNSPARTRLLKCMHGALENTESRQRVLLPDEQLKLLRQLIPFVRKHPANLSSGLRLPPIAWMKIGNQLSAIGIPLSSYFLERFLKWRTLNHQAERLALVVQPQQSGDSNADLIRKSAEMRPVAAYAVDVFLLADIPSFNQSPHNWKIKYCSIDSHGQEDGAAKRRPNRGLPKKSPIDQVGKGVFEEAQQCIKNAAEQRLIAKELLRRSRDGRLIFSGTRQELLIKLRRKFPGKLLGSDKVRLQAISLLAACGRYRRTKAAD